MDEQKLFLVFYKRSRSFQRTGKIPFTVNRYASGYTENKFFKRVIKMFRCYQSTHIINRKAFVQRCPYPHAVKVTFVIRTDDIFIIRIKFFEAGDFKIVHELCKSYKRTEEQIVMIFSFDRIAAVFSFLSDHSFLTLFINWNFFWKISCRRMFIDTAYRYSQSFVFRLSHKLQSKEAVSAEFKEIVFCTYWTEFKHIGHYPAECRFCYVFRLWRFFTHVIFDNEFRQSFSVRLTALSKRHDVNPHKTVRYHVWRKMLFQITAKLFLIGFIRWSIVTVKLLHTILLPADYSSLSNAFKSAHCSFCFSKIDAKSAKFYLTVPSAAEDDVSVCTHYTHIAGAVHHLSFTEFIRNEFFCSKIRSSRITLSDTVAGNTDLTHNAWRKKLSVFIENIYLCVGYRLSYGYIIFVRFGKGRPDCCFSRTVNIEDLRFRMFFKFLYQWYRKLLAAEDYLFKTRKKIKIVFIKHETSHFGRCRLYYFCMRITYKSAKSLSRLCFVIVCKYDFLKVKKRHQTFSNENIEHMIRYGNNAFFVLNDSAADAVFSDFTVIHHVSVSDHRAFRLSGWTGGKDHIARIIRGTWNCELFFFSVFWPQPAVITDAGSINVVFRNKIFKS